MVYHWCARLPRLFQSTCLLCGCRQHGQQQPTPAYFGLCHFCHADLPFIAQACRQCGIPLPDGQTLCGDCISTPPAFDSSCCAVTYEHAVIALVHRFKTRHHNAIGRLLAELLLSRIQSHGAEIDVIIPAPMHWQRNLQRGNDHAGLLAKSIARKAKLPLHNKLLERSHATPVQKQLNAGQRKKNLRQAFRCTAPVTGLRIAIVDDVMTTGSTMNAIATTLKNAGAAEVHCWAVARTPKR